MLCAIEDSRTHAVSLFTLAALIAFAPVARGEPLRVETLTVMCLHATMITIPFVHAAMRGRGGAADALGVFATGLRYPLPQALATVLIACFAGLISVLSEARYTRFSRDRRVPFFPCLTLAIVLQGSGA